jgi:hypothetical protein
MEVICSPRASADLSKVNETRTYLWSAGFASLYALNLVFL